MFNEGDLVEKMRPSFFAVKDHQGLGIVVNRKEGTFGSFSVLCEVYWPTLRRMTLEGETEICLVQGK